MTITECRDAVGCGVVYTPAHGAREDGVITSVNEHWAFVQYRGDTHSKATAPEDLQLLAVKA